MKRPATGLANGKFMFVKRGLSAPAVFLVSTAPLLAQQGTPQSASGAQGDKKEKPVAAADGDALRRAVENPVANLLSISVQNNTGFDLGSYNRTVNLTAQFYGNAFRPLGTSAWNMQLKIGFLFPKFTNPQ